MAIKLKPAEFYKALSRRTKLSADKIQDFWEIFDAFVVEELLRHGECYLPYLGNLELREMGGRNGHVPDAENGGIKTIYIEPYFQCRFMPAEVLKQNINNGRKPRYELKRERERYRTAMEAERDAKRIEELVAKQEEAMALARQQRLDKIAKKKEMAKLSKKKRAELEAEENKDPYDNWELEE